MDSLKDLLESRPQIVARCREGQLIPGYLDKGRLLVRGVLKMTDRDGAPVAVDLHKLKAIFFVRDFEGNPNYMEDKTVTREPQRPGLVTRLRFEDNETLEGVTENSLELLTSPGFFFWPADPKSNNVLVYVLKDPLIGFRVLGVKHK